MKIIAIIPVHNEGWILHKNLTILNQFCDHILVAEDHSIDNTIEICNSFSKVSLFHSAESEHTIIRYNNRRKILLDAAREFEGYNIILAVDADELIFAQVLNSLEWNEMLTSIKPGESYHLPWIWIWKDPHHYRDDNSIWSNRWMYCLFRDDRVTNYSPGNRHEARIPQPLVNKSHPFPHVKLLHYAQVAKNRCLSRQCGLRVYEYAYLKLSSFQTNSEYIITKDERDLKLHRIPNNWLEPWEKLGIDLTHFDDPELNHFDIEVLRKFSDLGIQCFSDLDIWDINWEYKRQLALSAGIEGLPDKPIVDPRTWEQRLCHEYLHKNIATPWWRFNPALLVKKFAKRIGLRRYHLEKIGLLKPKL